ncbi:hypothetical protein AB205_0203000 [Aquarana catesbeiana]|uniref:Uncharacterized protein n=1 Tax=Aquarana catesbeiana TaxID=8400 RepID=A0A2G9P135_AQUCT|nr:hypothetical protein AB205_0203000 [Aquarana catesbeiana]
MMTALESRNVVISVVGTAGTQNQQSKPANAQT